MENHSCEAAIITCIDFRLQDAINNWISENFSPRTFDRVAFAGGVKELDTILKQIDISARLHHIKRAILINHEDCGAYGESGTKGKHAQDLKKAADELKKSHPELKVDTYYLHLDGAFELLA